MTAVHWWCAQSAGENPAAYLVYAYGSTAERAACENVSYMLVVA